jgi:hypothetical protein
MMTNDPMFDGSVSEDVCFGGRRRHIARPRIAVVASIMVLSLGGLVACSDGDDPTGDGDGASATRPTPVSTIVAPTSPAATAPLDQPVVGASTLPPVSIGEPAEVESGLSIRVLEVERIEIDEPRPGEFAGPAIAVVVEVENVSEEPVDLIGIVVTAADADDVPLSMNLSSPNAPLEGVLDSGETRSGTYLFTVGDDDSGVVVRIEDALSPEAIIVEL